MMVCNSHARPCPCGRLLLARGSVWPRDWLHWVAILTIPCGMLLPHGCSRVGDAEDKGNTVFVLSLGMPWNAERMAEMRKSGANPSTHVSSTGSMNASQFFLCDAVHCRDLERRVISARLSDDFARNGAVLSDEARIVSPGTVPSSWDIYDPPRSQYFALRVSPDAKALAVYVLLGAPHEVALWVLPTQLTVEVEYDKYPLYGKEAPISSLRVYNSSGLQAQKLGMQFAVDRIAFAGRTMTLEGISRMPTGKSQGARTDAASPFVYIGMPATTMHTNLQELGVRPTVLPAAWHDHLPAAYGRWEAWTAGTGLVAGVSLGAVASVGVEVVNRIVVDVSKCQSIRKRHGSDLVDFQVLDICDPVGWAGDSVGVQRSLGQ